MTDFTPTTEQVRSGYAIDPEAEYHDPITNPASPVADRYASARAALARWRVNSTEGPWERVWDAEPSDETAIHMPGKNIDVTMLTGDALLVLAMTNSRVLEVLDGMLTTASLATKPGQVSSWFPKLADAIVRADEEMHR
jgi:hypothetical protein